jgi:hypothetical protein
MDDTHNEPMTVRNNKFTFWILLSTFIISIGAGHGVAPMVMIQFWTLTNTESETWLLSTILFSSAQLALILSIFRTTDILKKLFVTGGITISIIGIGSLINIGLEDYNSAIPTYVTAIPFAILVVKQLLYK